MAEIPLQITFEELLSYTFPGFFSAITLFMLIDVWSPFDLTSLAIKDLTSFASFIGLILIFGTIFGLIIDGITNSIIQDFLFKKVFPDIDDIKNCLLPDRYLSEKKIFVREHRRRQYFFIGMGEKSMEYDKYLSSGYFHYSEFYSNISISLIFFSAVVPFYLFYALQISWLNSRIIALITGILALICFYSSCSAYKGYSEATYSLIRGYLDAKQ